MMLSIREKREKWRAWRAAHPEEAVKRRARYLARKHLKPSPCEVCGETRVYAHHEDHSKPLEVRWLCKDHHGLRHSQFLGKEAPDPIEDARRALKRMRAGWTTH